MTIQVTQKSYDDCRICRQGSRELILKAWVAKSGVLSRREGEFVERVCLMEDSGWNSFGILTFLADQSAGFDTIKERLKHGSLF